jgi:hypothetical protein
MRLHYEGEGAHVHIANAGMRLHYEGEGAHVHIANAGMRLHYEGEDCNDGEVQHRRRSIPSGETKPERAILLLAIGNLRTGVPTDSV